MSARDFGDMWLAMQKRQLSKYPGTAGAGWMDGGTQAGRQAGRQAISMSDCRRARREVVVGLGCFVCSGGAIMQLLNYRSRFLTGPALLRIAWRLTLDSDRPRRKPTSRDAHRAMEEQATTTYRPWHAI